MTNNEIYLAIVVMTFMNFLTRVFPFIFFLKKDPPPMIVYIETYFPPVIMTILVFFTIKDVDLAVFPYGFKEISAILFTAFLHIWKNNYLVSIFLGTLYYMFLVQS
ncbi:MAG: AzlD domain-containing protein [Arcobacteraceae bacterium]